MSRKSDNLNKTWTLDPDEDEEQQQQSQIEQQQPEQQHKRFEISLDLDKTQNKTFNLKSNSSINLTNSTINTTSNNFLNGISATGLTSLPICLNNPDLVYNLLKVSNEFDNFMIRYNILKNDDNFESLFDESINGIEFA